MRLQETGRAAAAARRTNHAYFGMPCAADHPEDFDAALSTCWVTIDA
jgi:hypothetical protein